MRHECRCPKCNKKLAEMEELLRGNGYYRKCPGCGRWVRWLTKLDMTETIVKNYRCPYCERLLDERCVNPVWIKCPRCKNVAVF